MGEPGRSIQGIDLFDATLIDAGCRGYSGAIFDGRYIYYAPLNNGNFHGRVLRYDTTLAFESRAAWAEFDSAQIDPDSRGFVNALFDGRYLYLVPYFNGRHHGHVTRYDTRAPFEHADSWLTFDVQSVDPHCRGFGFIDDQLAVAHVVPKRNISAHPHAPLAGRREFVADAFADHLALELREGQQDI